MSYDIGIVMFDINPVYDTPRAIYMVMVRFGIFI